MGGLAISKNSIVAVDPNNHRIHVNDLNGRFIRLLGESRGILRVPRGVEVDGSGNIYVADTMNNRIQVFSPSGKFLKTIGKQ